MKFKIILLSVLASISFGQFIPIPTPTPSGGGGGGSYPTNAVFDSIEVRGVDVTTEFIKLESQDLSISNNIVSLSNSLASVAFSGDYNDLTNTPPVDFESITNVIFGMMVDGFTYSNKTYKIVIDNVSE